MPRKDEDTNMRPLEVRAMDIDLLAEIKPEGRVSSYQSLSWAAWNRPITGRNSGHNGSHGSQTL